jgi:hypothetical protein
MADETKDSGIIAEIKQGVEGFTKKAEEIQASVEKINGNVTTLLEWKVSKDEADKKKEEADKKNQDALDKLIAAKGDIHLGEN